jgi:hypothetical protein
LLNVQSTSKTEDFPYIGKRVTKDLRDEDVGIVLCATVSKSLSTGCSDLHGFLVLGKISQEEVDLRNARLESLYALQLLESAGFFFQANEALDIGESPSNHHGEVL